MQIRQAAAASCGAGAGRVHFRHGAAHGNRPLPRGGSPAGTHCRLEGGGTDYDRQGAYSRGISGTDGAQDQLKGDLARPGRRGTVGFTRLVLGLVGQGTGRTARVSGGYSACETQPRPPQSLTSYAGSRRR